jgi:hypothetical protein
MKNQKVVPVSGGEGDRESDRRFRKSARKFVSDGKVDAAAADAEAAQDDPKEKASLKQAEKIGRSKAKGQEGAPKKNTKPS